MAKKVKFRLCYQSVLLFLFISSANCIAQDIQFSQFYAAAQYLNPAFAGSLHYNRASFQQRIQWPGLGARYLTTLAAFDAYFPKKRSGFGAMAIMDFQGASTISSNEFHLQYSYEIPVTSKITVRGGLQAGVGRRQVNYSQLLFPDQFDDDGYLGGTKDVHGKDAVIYPDFSSGVLVNSTSFWLGFSAHHLNMPNIAVFNGTASRMPAKFALVGGYRFILKSISGNIYAHDKVEIIPTFHYKNQGKSDQLDLGAYFNYQVLVFGVWYRGIPVKRYQKKLHNNESFVFLAGLKIDNIRVGYSYDTIVSMLIPARPSGAHELSVSYTFIEKKGRRLKKRLPCPSF